jgi:hypothetical protein
VPGRFAPMWRRKAERIGGITNQFLMHIRTVFSSLASQFLWCGDAARLVFSLPCHVRGR